MNKFTKNLNFYIIKYLLKINKFLGKNRLFQESGFCEFSKIKDNLNCKRLSIQLYQHDDKSYDKEELFKILPLLLDNGIEIELIDFDRILENEDIRTLQQISPKIKVNFRYMIDSFWSGNNVETTYDMECYSKILDKIEYLTKVTKTNFSQEEKQVMFIINQLSEYINYTNNKSNDNKQYTQQSSLKGALLDRDTVCIGYAMAFERCMSNLGFENKIVLGRDKEDPKVKLWSANHAWNSVKINGKWYNVDITSVSYYKACVNSKDVEVPKTAEHEMIEKCILSDDINFINHYKAEDNGITCEEPLKNRFEIYDNVKKYRNVLEGYDKGKRNTMLQIKLESNDSSEIINTDTEKISERISKDTIDEEIK